MKKTTLFKGIKSTFIALFFGIPFIGNAQTNIAPKATVTADGAGGGGCRTGACSTLNDLNYGTCGTQEMWISTTPPNAVGVDFIQFDFPNVETFDTIIIHHGSATTRFLTGGTIQYFDGSSWITHSSFSNLPMQCVNKIPISKLSTDRFRITSFLMQGTGQLSNPNFREIEIISAPTGANDAAVLAIDSPSVFCAGSQPVYATIANLGVNQINAVTVNWEVNGVAQTPVNYTQLLDTITGAGNFKATIMLGTAVFNAGVNNVKVFTSNPNSAVDTVNVNDTIYATPTTATAPTSVTVLSATLNSATIDAVGGAGTVEYEFGPLGFAQSSGTMGSSPTSLFTINGLTASTTYDVYVRSNCGGADSSSWVGPITFNTAYGVPYFEDFELFTVGNAVNPWPRGWSSTNNSSAPRWESEDATGANENSLNTGPFYDNTTPSTVGGMYLYLETSGGSLGDSSDMVSPPIYIDTAYNNVLLEFYYHMYGSAMGDLKLYVDTNGVSDLLLSFSGQQQTAGSDPWRLASTNLVGYQGKSVVLRFAGIRGSSYESDMSIDDIRLSIVAPLNAGVVEVQSPSGAICPGTTTPVVGVKNFGSNC